MGALTSAFKRLWVTASMLASWLHTAFSQTDALHQARFARVHELSRLFTADLADLKTRLLLGIGPHGQFVSVRGTKTLPELGNCLVVAPTRGGKGLLAVSQLLTWNQSAIVNDIKGDLYQQTAGYRATLGNVYVIDPTGWGNRYDPLHGRMTEDELYASAHHLLYQAHEGEAEVFTLRAMVMLNLMLYAARRERIAPFPYIRFLDRIGPEGTAARLHSISPELAQQFLHQDFLKANFDNRFLLSCWGTMSARLRPLLTETIIRSLSGADFTAGELMTGTRPVTVYLRVPERELGALAPLIRLLFASFIDTLITTYDEARGQGCRPVLVLADEAGRTAIPMLADHAATVVGRHISLWVAVQSLSQLKTVYGAYRADTLMNNCDSQIFYRQASQETAEYLERSLGYRSGYARSETLQGGQETSEGRAERPVPLLSSQDVTQLTDSEVIAFHHNLRPMRLARLDWREHPVLIQRRNIPLPRVEKLPPLTEDELRTGKLLTTNNPADEDDELTNPGDFE
jgi:type IV secretory pathway TraG/TraD family ATPase VirD4